MNGIPWDKEAENALMGVPFFVRGLARRKVEERVRNNGGVSVRLSDFREAEAKFRGVAAGRTEGELSQMLPRENLPGVEMVIFEECHNELSGCPNVLIRTSEWKRAIEERFRERDFSERLRKRVRDDRILYHHKLRVSVSGCPNGCSRPQTADIGVVGCVVPGVDAADCTSCGECAGACPDAAITVEGGPPEFDLAACQGCLACRNVCPNECIRLSAPGARLLVGGRLGRHPRFAAVAGEFATPGELVAEVESVVADYIERARPGERLGDYAARRGTGVNS
ncbi:MAG: 4Fe-4S binding protein [bacterium]